MGIIHIIVITIYLIQANWHLIIKLQLHLCIMESSPHTQPHHIGQTTVPHGTGISWSANSQRYERNLEIMMTLFLAISRPIVNHQPKTIVFVNPFLFAIASIAQSFATQHPVPDPSGETSHLS
jgi:hypothetical protein